VVGLRAHFYVYEPHRQDHGCGGCQWLATGDTRQHEWRTIGASNTASVAHAENHTRHANTPLAAAAFFNQTILPSKDKTLQQDPKNEENATGTIHPRIRGVQESEIKGD
jgi:hypothetical protein